MALRKSCENSLNLNFWKLCGKIQYNISSGKCRGHAVQTSPRHAKDGKEKCSRRISSHLLPPASLFSYFSPSFSRSIPFLFSPYISPNSPSRPQFFSRTPKSSHRARERAAWAITSFIVIQFVHRSFCAESLNHDKRICRMSHSCHPLHDPARFKYVLSSSKRTKTRPYPARGAHNSPPKPQAAWEGGHLGVRRLHLGALSASLPTVGPSIATFAYL